MKSLNERFQERAYRKLENASESTSLPSGDVGFAANLINQANDAVRNLSDEQRAELEDILGFEARVESEEASVAFDDSGNFKYAGIGLVNPLVVPVADQPAPVSLSEVEARAGNGGGAWGDGSNANGRAVEAATAAASAPSGAGASGWNLPGDDGLTPVKSTMSKADLEAIAAKEEVDISSASNNDDRVKLIEEARAAKASN